MIKHIIFFSAILNVNIALAQQCPYNTITSQSIIGEIECIPKSTGKAKNSETTKGQLATWEFSYFKLGSDFDLDCAASFKDTHGGVVFAVSKQKDMPGLLILHKNENSRSEKSFSHEMMATIKEDAEPASSVKAFITQKGKTKYFIFAVPTSESLIQAIKDKSEITVTIENDTPFTASYHDGSVAKQGLSQCILNTK